MASQLLVERELERVKEQREELRRYVSNARATSSVLDEMSKSVSHDAMLPLFPIGDKRTNLVAPAGYVRGRFVHTNEVLVSLGGGYYAEMSASRASEHITRRVEQPGGSVVESLELVEKTCDELNIRRDVSALAVQLQEMREASQLQDDTDTVTAVGNEGDDDDIDDDDVDVKSQEVLHSETETRQVMEKEKRKKKKEEEEEERARVGITGGEMYMSEAEYAAREREFAEVRKREADEERVASSSGGQVHGTSDKTANTLMEKLNDLARLERMYYEKQEDGSSSDSDDEDEADNPVLTSQQQQQQRGQTEEPHTLTPMRRDGMVARDDVRSSESGGDRQQQQQRQAFVGGVRERGWSGARSGR